MSEEIDQNATELDLTVDSQEASTQEVVAKTPAWVVILLLLCVLSSIALGVIVYQILQNNEAQMADSQEQFSGFSGEVEQRLTVVDEIQSLATEIQQTTSEQATNLSALQTQQDSLEQAVTVLSENQPNSQQDWAVAEIEHLMNIAIHQLQLAENVPAALAALEAADVRIRDLGEPALFDVRQQLTTDINALKGINRVDISGMSLYLSDLIARVDSLPVKENPIVSEAETGDPATVDTSSLEGLGWQDKLKQLPAMMWNELKTLLVINYDKQAGSAFILPQQEYYLYQNLRLQLEHAKFAVLSRDNANLEASVDQILQWLNLHFDNEDAGVTNVMASLEQMKEVQLSPELPDITASLQSLRAFLEAQQAEQQ